MTNHTNIEHLTRTQQKQLTNALTNVITWIAETLDDTITRQHGRTTNPKVSGTTNQPLPYNDTASEIGWNLRNTLNAWITETANARHYPHPGQLNLTPAATWLRKNIIGLAISNHAQTAADEIHDAINQATTYLDKPTRPTYLGPCTPGTCNSDLWALPDQDPIICRTCNTTWDRTTINQRLHHTLRNQHLTARQLTHIVKDQLGTTIKPTKIYELSRRNNPPPVRGLTPHGHRLYRVGDILDALTKPTPK